MTSGPHPARPFRSRKTALPVVLLAGIFLAVLAVRAPAAEPPAKPAMETPKPAAETPKPAAAPAPQATPAAGAEKTADDVFMNMKVLNTLPASQVMPIMRLMQASLGVHCDFCHVTEGDRFDLDTKPEKETAREMIRMVLSINKENFEGRTVVSCNTCHRGQEHPVRVPPIGPAPAMAASHTHGAAEAEEHEKLPSAADVLDHYLQALGGRAALEGVKSRVSRGTLLHMKMVDPDTPNQRVVNRGQEDPFEIVQQAPDRVTVTLGAPPHQSVQRLEGTSGTIRDAQAERPMTQEEVARVAEANDLRKDLELRDHADKARVTGREQIDGKDAFVVRMAGEGGVSQTLYFDVQSGLLLRQVINRPTVVGPDPEQVDFADYRNVDGVKVPFVIKRSFLDDDYLGTTRKLTEVQDN